MSKFLTDLQAELVQSEPALWKLTLPLIYQSGVANDTFVVPVGFTTDLASVPRIPIAYFLAGGTSNEASVIHDWLYSTHEVDRATADAVLREASALTGVPSWRRWIMWAGVRLGGGSHWAVRVVKPTTPPPPQ